MPIKDYFIFDGKKSTDYGLYMASDSQAIHPARRGETFPIPGRNGVIVREDGAYDTYTQTYDVLLDTKSMRVDVYQRARDVAAWLLGSRGFCRLEDSYEPEYFRLARCAAQMSVEKRLARFGRAQIPFECQPQRFLKSGEMGITMSGDNSNYSFTIENVPDSVKSVKLKYAASMSGSNTLVLINVNDKSDYIRTTEEIDGWWAVQTIDLTDDYKIVGVNGIINSPDKTLIFIDNNGNETTVLVKVGGFNSYYIFNPTDYPSQPLIEVLDKAGSAYSVEITQVAETVITGGGNVMNYSSDGVYTTQPVSVSSLAYVYVTGTGYTFLDSNGTTPPAAQYQYGKPIKFERGIFNNQKLTIPDGADTIVLMGNNEHSAQLSAQNDRTQTGNYILTVGSTSVNVDFTKQDDFILDCDLHDARFVDGSNANAYVSFSDPKSDYPTFPEFGSGATAIFASTNPNVEVKIVPRWWTL